VGHADDADSGGGQFALMKIDDQLALGVLDDEFRRIEKPVRDRRDAQGAGCDQEFLIRAGQVEGLPVLGRDFPGTAPVLGGGTARQRRDRAEKDETRYDGGSRY